MADEDIPVLASTMVPFIDSQQWTQLPNIILLNSSPSITCQRVDLC